MPTVARPPDSSSMTSTDRDNDRVPLFDDLRQAVTEVTVAIADLASSSLSAMTGATIALADESTRPPPVESRRQVIVSTEAPRRPDSPPQAQPTAAVPGGLVAVAAAHPYSTAFLMGALLTGSCLAGAAAANSAFARSARRSSSTVPVTRAASALSRPAPGYEARLERMEALLREAAKRPLPVQESNLAERLENITAVLASNTSLNRKIQASLESIKERRRSELISMRQEVQDQQQAVAFLTKSVEDAHKSLNELAASLKDNVEILQRAADERSKGSAGRGMIDNTPDTPTPMDVNVASSVASIAQRAATSGQEEIGAKSEQSIDTTRATIARLVELVKKSEPPLDEVTGSALQQLVAVVKAAEPVIAARFQAASAEWEMIKAIKASEPYLVQDNMPGSARSKLLQAVKEAEPFVFKRFTAASSIWRLVQVVKASEPHLAGPNYIPQAEYDIVRAIKAAEPYLVEDLDMGSAASKMLRKVQANSPHFPPYGTEAASCQLQQKVKHSEPVLRLASQSSESVNPAPLKSLDSDTQPQQPKPVRRIKASSVPLTEREPQGLGTPSESARPCVAEGLSQPAAANVTEAAAADAATDKQPPPEACETDALGRHAPGASGATNTASAQQATNAGARSYQPVEHLGIDDSGEWKFTITATPEKAPALGEGVKVGSCQIFLSRQFQRSWAGELLSLWQASVRTMTWSVGPFTTAIILNPDVDMVLLDGAWWHCSRDGDVYTIREMVLDNC